MKTCPKCQMQYDEEIIRFCTKDGTPLVSEEKPSFIAMPSESIEANSAAEDELGEETVIRRNRPANIPPPVPGFDPPPLGRQDSQPEPPPQEAKQRVVIPVGEERKQEVRPAQAAQPTHYSNTRKSNTGLVVALTLLGTLAVLGGGIGAWWFLGGNGKTVANTNINSNSNIFIPTNVNQDPNVNSDPFGNFNIGTNGNFNVASNVNTNANANRPTPTPKPTQTPKQTPTPNSNANTNVSSNTGSNANTNVKPSNIVITPGNNGPIITGTPTPTPKPTATPTAPPQNVNVGVINSRAANLVKPAYPSAAKQMGASGQVQVAVSVDENGNVISARATSGHPLLRQAAEAAARQSRFNPVRVGDRTVKASGTIVYNFIRE